MFDNFKNAVNKLLKRISYKTPSKEDVESIIDDILLILIENDVALEVAEDILNNVKNRLLSTSIPRFSRLDELVKQTLYDALDSVFKGIPEIDLVEVIKRKTKPYSILFLGVNGVGKTTTIAKVAYLLKTKGFKVLLACSDTFRAAAIEQLRYHASRLAIPMIAQQYGADPAAVAYDALKHAEARGFNVVLIDTAGRQHSNINLMDELRKIVRVIKPDMKILILDALTGNDAFIQAKTFNECIGIDAIIMTKVDADVKGGAILSAVYATKKPVIYLGVGQKYTDLIKFDKVEYLKKLLTLS